MRREENNPNKVDPMAGAGGVWHCTARNDACMSGSRRCCVLLPPAAESMLQHKHASGIGHKEVSCMCVSTFGRAHWMQDKSV